jgi:hypothetical protein
MNNLFNPQNRKFPGFFHRFHFYIFSNKRCGEAFCGSGGNCVSEGHGIRSFEPSRFIHNRIRNGFNNVYGLGKNGFNSDYRSMFPGNIKPVIVHLKQLDNTHRKTNSAGSGLLNKVKDNICSGFAVKNSKQRASIKKVMHFLRSPHPLKLGVFFFLVSLLTGKICVHGISFFINPGKRGQGSYSFSHWHGFRGKGKFNFRFANRQLRWNFNSYPAASRYFNRLFDGHISILA